MKLITKQDVNFFICCLACVLMITSCAQPENTGIFQHPPEETSTSTELARVKDQLAQTYAQLQLTQKLLATCRMVDRTKTTRPGEE